MAPYVCCIVNRRSQFMQPLWPLLLLTVLCMSLISRGNTHARSADANYGFVGQRRDWTQSPLRPHDVYVWVLKYRACSQILSNYLNRCVCFERDFFSGYCTWCKLHNIDCLPCMYSLTLGVVRVMFRHKWVLWCVGQPFTFPGTPTRSSFYSGRLPVHVLTQLADPCDGAVRIITTTSHMLCSWSRIFFVMCVVSSLVWCSKVG